MAESTHFIMIVPQSAHSANPLSRAGVFDIS
jgi:hypothetical protein